MLYNGVMIKTRIEPFGNVRRAKRYSTLSLTSDDTIKNDYYFWQNKSGTINLYLGKAVQVHPINPTLKEPGTRL